MLNTIITAFLIALGVLTVVALIAIAIVARIVYIINAASGDAIDEDLQNEVINNMINKFGMKTTLNVNENDSRVI